MRTPLRLLLVEDSREDASFLLRELKRDGYEFVCERVETPEEMAAALEGREWDVVVSDYFMPGFGALEALALLQKQNPDLPFIVISSKVGEESAVEAMRAGAHDYVMKDNLARLGAAIERELRGAEARREKRQAEEKYRSIFENAVDGIFQTTVEGKPLTANPAMARILGYESPEELLASIRNIVEQLYVEPARRTEFGRLIEKHDVVSGFETELYRKDGGTIWVSIAARAIREAGGELVSYEGIVEDITERKRAEEALKESEEQYRATFELAAVGMAHVSLLGKFLRVNRKLCETLGYERGELLKMGLEDVTYPEDVDGDARHVRRVLAGEQQSYSIEKRYIKKDGSVAWIHLGVSLARDREGAPKYFISAFQDITERKLAELVPEPLTPQEFAVLKLIMQGRTNHQISDELTYSYGAIKLHVRNVLAKLGVKSREEAAARAVEIGLLPPAPRGFTRGAG